MSLLVRIVVATLILLLWGYHSGSAVADEPITLRVALYPYVPNARELFYKFEARFEAEHPGVNVELVDSYEETSSKKPISLNKTYYSGGLLQVEADVYEIDTVLLDQMVRKGRIGELRIPQRDFLPGTREAVRLSGKTWGIPHWVCGNFVFYEKSDSAIERAKTWKEFAAAFGHDGVLLLDLKGASTLGEWYLTTLAATFGDPGTILARVQSNDFSGSAVVMLSQLLDRCPAGWCRNDNLHSRAGYYARQFAHRKARAYIGYSETLHYALQEIMDNCTPTDGCREPHEISVRSLPPLTPQGKQVGWVDVLAISSSVTGRKKALAAAFIDFLTSWDGYRLILNSEVSTAPLYLLPALRLTTPNPELEPPLYPEFYKAFGVRLLFTADRLNEALRRHGTALDCTLPNDRLDTTWRQSKCTLTANTK